MGNVSNFEAASQRMSGKLKLQLQHIAAATINNQAFAARAAVQARMRSVFSNPKAITINSVMVTKADRSAPISGQVARVYIRDDVPSASTQPDVYLLAEEAGGARSDKRSERLLMSAGIISRGQQTTPGPGLPVDSSGKTSGPGMVQLLSRIKAFGEMGFTANANAKTTDKLRRAARARASKQARLEGASPAGIKAARAAAFAPIVKGTGNEYFLMKSKLQEGFAGVFRLIGRGQVQPMLWFDTRSPRYTPRFPFRAIVARAAAASFNASLEKALAFIRGQDH